MRYYIADCHFFHKSLNNGMDCRGFKSVEEMNEYMVKQWNSRVRKNDEVVVLGDLSVGNAVQTNEVLKELNGRIFMVKGNHDRFLDIKGTDLNRFKWVKDLALMKDNGRRVVLSHYFIPTYPGQYSRTKDGENNTWMLYGHVHNTLDMKYIDDYCDMVRKNKRKSKRTDEEQYVQIQAINCFCMFSDYVPLTLDEWIEVEKTRKEKFPYRE